MAKYKNKRCEFDNGNEVLTFASQAERARYVDLLDKQRRGLISNLRCQPKFLLQEGFYRNGKKYRPEFYIADFEYREDYQTVIEDAKGMETQLYKSKRKRFLELNPDLIFREVRLKGHRWEIKEL
jgi:hypothetical protein